jgi:hypothetical protein
MPASDRGALSRCTGTWVRPPPRPPWGRTRRALALGWGGVEASERVVLEGGVFRFTALGEMWIGKTRLVVRGSDSRGGTVFHGLISAWEKCGSFFRIWAFVISLGQWVFFCKWQPSPSAKYAVTKKKLGVVKNKTKKKEGRRRGPWRHRHVQRWRRGASPRDKGG